MAEEPVDAIVDTELLRAEVRQKYKEVAVDPHGDFHFHTGRPLAARLGYDPAPTDALPDIAVESFAGVANPFSIATLVEGERVVDIGSGAGFDSFIAAGLTGPEGRVIGVDMTQEMLDKSRSTASALGFDHVEFREGLAEELPIPDEWADVVISNGVINLCADKQAVFQEIMRVLRPGGRLQFADIANGAEVPEEAVRDIDLWTAWIAGGLPCAGWIEMMRRVGFVDVEVGPAVDVFGGAGGEANARTFEVYGYAFVAHKPA